MPDLEHPAERIQGGVPNLDWNHMTGWYGGEEGGHIGFSPVAPLTGRDAIALRDLLRGHGRGSAGLDYIGGAAADQRAQLRPHHDGHLRHQERGPGARRLRRRASCSSARRRSSATASTARTSTSWTSPPTQYSFGDHAYRRFCETIKDAVDPAGILSPGKQGIWPASMRDGGGLSFR